MKHEVTLRFKTAEQKRFFLDQLSDGWGENHVDLRCRGDLDDAAVITVDPTVDKELWEHHKAFHVRMRRMGFAR